MLRAFRIQGILQGLDKGYYKKLNTEDLVIKIGLPGYTLVSLSRHDKQTALVVIQAPISLEGFQAF